MALREIKTAEEYEELKALSVTKVQALIMTSPSCNACQYFKKTGHKACIKKFGDKADFAWINADECEEFLGRKSMFPMWQFFALGEKQKREEPGTSDFMLTDNIERYADWIERSKES